ncbi:prepilin-type N-terminal cleavage/methylation domain-containing protein [Variovorax sp. JS1663]|uniref:prepilin-type N-terminal cleavage/methylation domain-containing protein n=1 Tax=Variovorax sp. JS1663 TaxID=1851577 RepID=UPI000B344474|nr:prepilin-type N-terminal cleavage/methylation domain-containing protein [Variovorax sp. JS1663]OUM03209.1 general secretion pathway protein J [Variovorax sp. JS1663]
MKAPRRARGFTLIELMVAVAVMALLALVSWRGLDGMARAQAQNRERGDAVLALQATLLQWTADLDAITVLSQTRALDWDGRTLRLTRRSTDTAQPMVYVVAWTQRADAGGVVRWFRWQSPGLTTRPAWQQAWDRAAAWAQDGSGSSNSNELRGTELGLMPLDSWQLLYYRNDAWSPAVGAEALTTSTQLPDGVRLVLSLPPGPALAGLITRDWVRPTAAVAKTTS